MLEVIIGFVIAICILVFVHELGHFLFAKWTGCRVDEFAVGFKPALFQKQYKETNYVLGLIPVGGYVKIWGENGSVELEGDPNNPTAFYNRPRWAQAIVLFAGILFNLILAWLCFSLLLTRGLEVSQTQFPDRTMNNAAVQIVGFVPDYPAASSVLEIGDEIIEVHAQKEHMTAETDWKEVSDFLGTYGQEGVEIIAQNTQGDVRRVNLTAESFEDRHIVGLQLDTIGEVQLPVFEALIEGLRMTWDFSVTIVWFLGNFIADLFVGQADTDNVAGPVGIASFAGESWSGGFDDFVWFIAVLSLNLAIFNLLPIPALDGGRLVFVGIESVIRRPLNPDWFYKINMFGFIFLMGLMLLVTIFDISRLFN